MKCNLRYLRYVLLHKWYVIVAGRKTQAPLWRLIIHDWSKFTWAEWGPYVRQFYVQGPSAPGDFERAWLHHWHRNPHHWQFWLLAPEKGGSCDALEMPEKFVREMVADWASVGRVRSGRWEVAQWWQTNRSRIILHPNTEALVEAILADKAPK